MKAPGRRNLVVFDGDDTLWRTQEIYDAIKAQFVELLAEEGITASNALATLDKIDAEAAGVEGFTVERFLDSMLRTYVALAARDQRQPRAASRRRIRELGRPLLGDYELYPDSIAVLSRLKVHFKLVLATKGQRSLQEEKVRRLRIGSFFEHVYILERKTESEYRDILESQQTTTDRAWAVGNSIRSDINPALRIGMRAIWIRRRTWLYEEESFLPQQAIGVNSLSEAADVLLSHRPQLLGVSS